jgi:hypothetical protein
MSLSVVSPLARLGIDPWKEAGRLSALSKESAAATLDQLIARLPGEQWQRLDRSRIVARLVELLPRDAPAREAGPPGSRLRPVRHNHLPVEARQGSMGGHDDCTRSLSPVRCSAASGAALTFESLRRFPRVRKRASLGHAQGARAPSGEIHRHESWRGTSPSAAGKPSGRSRILCPQTVPYGTHARSRKISGGFFGWTGPISRLGGNGGPEALVHASRFGWMAATLAASPRWGMAGAGVVPVRPLGGPGSGGGRRTRP